LLCPTCKSRECRRSRRCGVADRLLSLLGVRPWRCRDCHSRFRAWLVPARYALYAHCPDCGNLELQRVARDRVVRGWDRMLGRMLFFPAYRCDDCRNRFFSLGRFYRVHPAPAPPLIARIGAQAAARGVTSHTR